MKLHAPDDCPSLPKSCNAAPAPFFPAIISKKCDPVTRLTFSLPTVIATSETCIVTQKKADRSPFLYLQCFL